jgi:adenosine deaminase
MTQICEAGIVLELCPSSNLLAQALESEEALRDTFRAFLTRRASCRP